VPSKLPVANYGPPIMIVTPWGDAEGLRDRKLPPGRSTPRDEVKRNQRERLFAAMVACCEEQGYENTSVADLLEISGISRVTFYEHFDDKADCFSAAIQEALQIAVAAIARRQGVEGSAAERARSALEAFVELLTLQPAAARMVLVESYAAGERAVEPVRQAITEIGRLAHGALTQMPGHEGTPLELAEAIVGGFYRVVHSRLQTRREKELPELVPALWDWALSYPPPPQPLRLRGRRGVVALDGATPPFAAYSPEQRIIRSFAATVAERGYQQVTIADIAATASISQGTFYEYFRDKADALAAALDASGAQLRAATLPAARRAEDWPQAVRVALGGTCGFFAAEPAFAGMRVLAIYAAGPEALAQRDSSGTELLGTILDPAFENSPEVDEIVLEAILGAIYGTVYLQLRANGAEALPEIAPLLTYLALAPFLGAEKACAVAIGNARRER